MIQYICGHVRLGKFPKKFYKWRRLVINRNKTTHNNLHQTNVTRVCMYVCMQLLEKKDQSSQSVP